MLEACSSSGMASLGRPSLTAWMPSLSILKTRALSSWERETSARGEAPAGIARRTAASRAVRAGVDRYMSRTIAPGCRRPGKLLTSAPCRPFDGKRRGARAGAAAEETMDGEAFMFMLGFLGFWTAVAFMVWVWSTGRRK